jgi:hypothetical protein
MVAFSAWINPTRLRVSMITGKEPIISITAKRIMVIVTMDFKSNCIHFEIRNLIAVAKITIAVPDNLVNFRGYQHDFDS